MTLWHHHRRASIGAVAALAAFAATLFVRGIARQVPAGIGLAPPYEVEATPRGAFVAGGACFAHAQIQLEVGRPLLAPEKITFPHGL